MAGYDEHGHAPGRVALVDHALEGVGVSVVTGALGDRPLDVVLGHARVARLLDGGGERGVTGGIAAALARGDLDRPGELREELAALGVGGALLVLDGGPFGVAGHGVILGAEHSVGHAPRYGRVEFAGLVGVERCDAEANDRSYERSGRLASLKFNLTQPAEVAGP